MTPFDQLPTLEERFGPFVHMGRDEVEIWKRFLLNGGDSFAPFKYDIRVGEGIKMPEGSSPLSISIAWLNTTKRIDALSTSFGQVTLFEVKVRAGASVIGQLLTYRTLYHSTFNYNGRINLWVITDRLQPDMTAPLEIASIHWQEV